MKDQIPDPVQTLKVVPILSAVFVKILAAKDPDAIAEVMNSLTKEQLEEVKTFMKELVTLTAIAQVLSTVFRAFEASKASSAESNTLMSSEQSFLEAFKAFETSKAFGETAAGNNTPMTSEQFANLLHHSGLSQTEFAKALHVPQSNIGAWLNGSRPVPQKHIERIHRICMDTAAERFVAISRLCVPPSERKAA